MQELISQTTLWQQLQQHQKYISTLHIRDMFKEDGKRFSRFSTESCGILFDYSKNRLTQQTVELLLQLAETVKLGEWIDQMYRGEKINHTEQRAVLHVALRNLSEQPVYVDGENVMPAVKMVLTKIKKFTEQVRSGQWNGYTGKSIENIVNIGIGGSDLGPAMVTRALKYYHHPRLTSYFVSNVDATQLAEVLAHLNPETTLFVISSKTFTTQETMLNAHSARRWFLQKVGGDESAIAKHFVAVSTNQQKVIDFGIDPNNMFEFWDWVGGRYSLWSAIGLTSALMIGMDNFEKLLNGAHEMDKHFQTTDFSQNIPVLMGLIGIWYNNFFHAKTQAILPYDFALELLPAYLQQLVMESLGKQVTREGLSVDYDTCPIVWGAAGNNGQHAFYQLLHQGTHLIPADFIVAVHSHYEQFAHQEATLSNALAQTDALMMGRTQRETQAAMQQENLDPALAALQLPHRVFQGNKPTNTFVYDLLTPEILGALIAMYEHKVFVQGVCWHINPFDQWGVELGKQVANHLLPEFQKPTTSEGHDASTDGLLNYIKSRRKS